jgi:hypothetical protein
MTQITPKKAASRMFRVTVTSRHTLTAHELRLQVVVNAMPSEVHSRLGQSAGRIGEEAPLQIAQD